MDKCIINDTRKSFSRLSFSNHKKNKVIDELIRNIYYQNRDDALSWTTEMICSLYIIDLWKIYILFYCKHIHIHNIKICIFINNKFEEFKKLYKQLVNELDLKNNDDIREIFFTITIILCETTKDNVLCGMPLQFNLDNMYENLKATHIEYIKPFFKPRDPKEYYIPLNEFVYHLEITKQKTDIFYWIDWLIEYDIYLLKNKRKKTFEKRTFIELSNDNYNHNFIWTIWEIILHFSIKCNSLVIQTINSLLSLFKIKYKLSNNKTYKGTLYVALSLLITPDIKTHIKLIENTKLFNNLYDNTQIIFNEINKKNVYIERTI